MPGKPAVRPSMRGQIDAITADVAQAVVALRDALRAKKRALAEADRAAKLALPRTQRDNAKLAAVKAIEGVRNARAELDSILEDDA